MALSVLFVISDDKLRDHVRALVAPLENTWEIVFADGAREALHLLTTRAFAIIVTNSPMPDDYGTELLTMVAGEFPEITRLIIAHQQGEVMAPTVSEAHRMLVYPCKMEALKESIERTHSLRLLMSSEPLRLLIEKITMLPSLPDLYMRVMTEMRSPFCSLSAVGKIIETDVAMSVKVMKLVNSAFFGLSQQVTSPSLAVSLLGMETVKSMVLLFDVFAQFDRLKALAASFDLDQLQQHSLLVGGNARAIARYERLPMSTVDSLFLSGLFHDVGKLILVSNYPQEYNVAIKLSQNRDLDMTAAERLVFQATHAEVGAYLLSLWGFADPILEACAFHHHPERFPQTGINAVSVIHAANLFAHARKLSEDEIVEKISSATPMIATDDEQRVQHWMSSCQLAA